MNLRALSIILIVAVGLLQSCLQDVSEEKPKGKLQGLHKYYFPDGKLYLEINYKDSVPHGEVRRYFKAGGILESSNYNNGILHGISRTYYEGGKLSSETPYDSGRIHGVKKKFRKDGMPAYEAPYRYGQPCVGLKEFFLSGRPVDNYPSIVFKPLNELLKENRYILQIMLSDGSKVVEFYHGKLVDGKYIHPNADPIHTQNGVAKLYYYLPPGAFAMEKVEVVAKIKTDLGNYVLAEASHNLAVEHH